MPGDSTEFDLHGEQITSSYLLSLDGKRCDPYKIFEPHAGARLKVVRQMQDHVQIRFSEDKIGWIPSAAVGRIRQNRDTHKIIKFKAIGYRMTIQKYRSILCFGKYIEKNCW